MVVDIIRAHEVEEHARQVDSVVEDIVADLVHQTAAAVDQEIDETVKHIISDVVEDVVTAAERELSSAVVGRVVNEAAASTSTRQADMITTTPGSRTTAGDNPAAAVSGHVPTVPDEQEVDDADYVLISPGSPPAEHNTSEPSSDDSWSELQNDADEEVFLLAEPEPIEEEHNDQPTTTTTNTINAGATIDIPPSNDQRPLGVRAVSIVSSIISSAVVRATTGTGTSWAQLPVRGPLLSQMPLDAPEPEPVTSDGDGVSVLRRSVDLERARASLVLASLFSFFSPTDRYVLRRLTEPNHRLDLFLLLLPTTMRKIVMNPALVLGHRWLRRSPSRWSSRSRPLGVRLRRTDAGYWRGLATGTVGCR